MLRRKEIRPFHNTFKVMSMYYVYPKQMDKKSLRLYSLRASLLQLCYLIFIVLAAVMHLVLIKNDKIPVDISEDITMIVGGLTTFYLSIRNSVSYKTYQRLVLLLTDFRKFGKPANFDKAAKRSNFLSAVYSCYCFFGTIAYGIASIMESDQCYRVQLTVERNLFCGAYTTAWFPFNINVHLVFFIQYLLFIGILTPCALCCFLFMEMVEFLITHIEHLGDCLETVFQKSGDERRNMLKFSFKYHQHTLSLAAETRDGFRKALGFMSMLWAISFGAIANQVQHSKPVGAVIFLVGFITALAILSRAGQRLMDETLAVADKVYTTNWYEGTPSEVKNLQFMIARSHVACIIPATPFGRYEYALFIMIIKTAYSYVTVLGG